ncbi:MAG TPA: L,D-transpeptidase family protein [Bacteroidia bacterium]|nr:L,D-transpeptidase family protein [Bacteroidia bacterium]
MLKRITILVCISFLCFSLSGSFKKEQLKYSNVKTAYKEKWALVKGKLQKAGIDTSQFEVFIRVFKKEAELEVWARSKSASQFKLVETYAICRSSGELGPKRQQGDMQVPEGFYTVSIYQPNSAYYLALGISYPNKSDRIKGNQADPGGDIMIHGNCVTIGCMPLTDDKIKEVYLMAIEAHNNGQQNVPVHIFPTRLNNEGMAWLKANEKDATKLAFWNNIKDGFTYFETKKTIPTVSIDAKGDYTFQ